MMPSYKLQYFQQTRFIRIESTPIIELKSNQIKPITLEGGYRRDLGSVLSLPLNKKPIVSKKTSMMIKPIKLILQSLTCSRIIFRVVGTSRPITTLLLLFPSIISSLQSKCQCQCSQTCHHTSKPTKSTTFPRR